LQAKELLLSVANRGLLVEARLDDAKIFADLTGVKVWGGHGQIFAEIARSAF
jgi:hypothetical protein